MSGKVLPLPTTNETLAYALKRSLIATGAAQSVGSTWGDFKDAMARLGVRDEDAIVSIEVGVKVGGMGAIVREDDDPDGIEIKEL